MRRSFRECLLIFTFSMTSYVLSLSTFCAWLVMRVLLPELLLRDVRVLSKSDFTVAIYLDKPNSQPLHLVRALTSTAGHSTWLLNHSMLLRTLAASGESSEANGAPGATQSTSSYPGPPRPRKMP